MAVDLGKLKALRAEVAAAPGDVTLRLELIRMMLDAERPQDAWHHCIRILNQRPDHVEALRLARDAARTVGAVGRAREYEEQLGTLGPSSPAGAETGGRTFHVRGRTLRLIRGSGGRDDGDDH